MNKITSTDEAVRALELVSEYLQSREKLFTSVSTQSTWFCHARLDTEQLTNTVKWIAQKESS